jgi:hypothetical protein
MNDIAKSWVEIMRDQQAKKTEQAIAPKEKKAIAWVDETPPEQAARELGDILARNEDAPESDGKTR